MSAFKFKGPRPDLSQLVIDGKRVRLVSISHAYENAIFSEFTPDITTYMFPKPAQTTEETRAFIDESVAAFAKGNNLQLVILDKAADEFLGCCGLHGSEDAYSPEFGIWLKKAAHGKGLGKEAIHTLAFWAQEHIELDGFTYPVDKRNVSSRNIPESLNGEVVAEKVVKGMAGNVLDEVVYRIPLPLATDVN